MRRTALIDAGASALAVAFLVLATSHIPASREAHSLDAFAYALLVLAGGSLAFVRRQPWTAVALVTAVLMSYIIRNYPGGPIYVTGWVSLFSLGYHARRRNAFIGAAMMSAGLVIAAAASGRTEPLIHLVFIGWSAAAVFLGDALRSRREHLAGTA